MKILKLTFASLILAAVVLAVIAEDIENRTIRYRRSTVLKFDPGSYITDEDGAWTVSNARLGQLGSGSLIPATKPAFFTNYTLTASDSVIFCAGTNQLITVLSAVTAGAGKMFTIVASTNNGSVTVTNPNGTQTILGGLSVPVSATNRITIISDSVNWW